ncbi:MAG: vanadium-dependent haloperoxidase [Actinomycetota bacterium]|nr:vanadium-dependent haloperoxidase [Actinomycetota bacterium]
MGSSAARDGKRRVSRLLSGALAIAALLGGAASIPEAQAQGRGDSVVLRWNAAALAAVRGSRLGPPQVARGLAIIHTCIYDAWAAYDRTAAGTRLGVSLRRPAGERTLANQNKAISHAAYRAAVDIFPGLRTTLFDPLMASLGYNPSDTSTDVSTPSGVGNRACQAVLDFRHHDGSNQLGNTAGGSPGVAYSDYTGYQPYNGVMEPLAPFDPATVKDPNRWQPLRYHDATAVLVTPNWLAPHWNRVVPFALRTPSQLRSATGPAKFGSAQYLQQAQEVLAMSANLTDEHKAVVEYWADGPKSETPPGHWNLFAQFVSRRDQHGAGMAGIAADTKMFFALNNALLDASIVAWDNKVAFDSVRPITAVRFLFRGQPVRAWGGPNQGTRTIDGAVWLPYQPTYFPTPPFAEYTSGHSTFSAAGARVLELFTRSPFFGLSWTVPAGSSVVEPGATPARPVTLSWATFKDAADQAGISRRYGGIHFAQGDLDGRAQGKKVADITYGKAWALFNGATTYP